MQETNYLQTDIMIEEIEHIVDPFAAYQGFSCDRMPFLLESTLKDNRLGRFSILGSNPDVVIVSKNGLTHVTKDSNIIATRDHPFTVLDRELDDFGLVDANELPIPFAGGAVGYFGYDLNRQIERIHVAAYDDMNLPDLYLGLYRQAVVIDHIKNRTYVIIMPNPDRVNHKVDSMLLRDIQNKLQQKPREEAVLRELSTNNYGTQLSKLSSNFTRPEYEWAIDRAKHYINEGDIFQVNLAQRFSAPLYTSPNELYSRLRFTNPAPFSALLDYGSFSILSSSPERFLQVVDKTIETRPIKGTRPRHRDQEIDKAFIAELTASEKDRAEHIMIVDVERNDLGRICEHGSVDVAELLTIESYARVHHLVSTVSGELRPDISTGDILRATFPGGSITGAPKIRAMDIIEELEPHRRGVYTGSIGYISAHGVIDLNITIRTIITKDRTAYFHVGGGIVADSDPVLEYEETLHKASALFAALGIEKDVAQ